MKTRKTQIKWVTERYSNTREMRRYTLTLKRKIQAGLMMVPPHRLSPWQKVSPHNTGQQRHSQVTTHNQDSSSTSLSFFFGGGALVKTKLTAGRLSPTIITSQHNITTFLRLHFQEGMKGGGPGKRGRGGMSLFVTCFTTWENVAPCTVPSVGLDNAPTGREATMAVTRISSSVCDYD